MRKIISRLVSGLRWRLLSLVLLAYPLVGLTLHTAPEVCRQLVKDWKQRLYEMTGMRTEQALRYRAAEFPGKLFFREHFLSSLFPRAARRQAPHWARPILD